MGLEIGALMLILIGACAHMSYNRGQQEGRQEGILMGTEGTLDLLKAEGIIEIYKEANGEESIAPVQYYEYESEEDS